jgi:hypothetical protein
MLSSILGACNLNPGDLGNTFCNYGYFARLYDVTSQNTHCLRVNRTYYQVICLSIYLELS